MVFPILTSTSPNSQVDLLLSFCQQLKFSSVVLVGHDDGELLPLIAAAKILKSLSSTQVVIKDVVLIVVSSSREVISPFARVLLHTSLGRHILRPLLCPEMASRHAWHDASKLTSKMMELYKAIFFSQTCYWTKLRRPLRKVFVNLSSVAHIASYSGGIQYSDTRAYCQSKLANFFHAKELAIRFKLEEAGYTIPAKTHGCPGMNLGMTAVHFVLANLLYRFNWTTPDGKEVHAHAGSRSSTCIGSTSPQVMKHIDWNKRRHFRIEAHCTRIHGRLGASNLTLAQNMEGAPAEVFMEVEPNNTGMLEFFSPELLSLEEQEAKASELKQDACLEQSSSTKEADMQPASTEIAAPDEPVRGKANLDAKEEESKQQREGKSAGLEAEDDMEDQHPDGPGDPLLRSWDSQSHNRQACRTRLPGIQETREDHLGEEPQNGNANQRPREALREIDEEFRGFVHGDLSVALARRLLWLTVMA
ncbi:hypothetical protein SELMODRAFT_412039 [Selaginella moellendorffii]|uniref:Uncharacterized protein CYP792A10P n=1 Tax=Selaginella moellendorffii TaxID=88036 RepID=D8RJU9_SELML|nr:hypothetical protein SELMODRAFT_412039 [Selaginella moellendorffii]